MGAIVREFLEPKHEALVRIREFPLELDDGTTSKRLKAWAFENEDGVRICYLEVHRTAHLGQLSEVELETLFLHALDYGK